MGRYIDADALIKTVDDFPNCYNGWSDTYDKAYIIEAIEEAPTIDAIPIEHINLMNLVEVVRCKECRFCLVGIARAQYSNGKQRIENLCEKHKWSVRADDYCSYGERREP